MIFTLRLFGREVFSVQFERPIPVVDAEEPDEYEDEGDEVPQRAPDCTVHGEFGFAPAAPRTIDYPESRWDTTPYARRTA